MREESKQRLAQEAEIQEKKLQAILDQHNTELKVMIDESEKRKERAENFIRQKIEIERDEWELRKVLLKRWEEKKREVLGKKIEGKKEKE